MVSIVIITYNRSELLLKTLRSVINQTFGEFEIIVVDDGSTDDTPEIIKNLSDNRIKYLNFGKIGNLSKLRNLGIKNSLYEFIAFCDDDDMWNPEKLDVQLKYMDKYDFVCSNASVIDFYDNEIREKYFYEIEHSFEVSMNYLLSQGNCILTSSCLIRKNIFTDNDCYFDEKIFTNFCEDFELFIRLSKYCNIYFIDRALVKKRYHASVSGGLDNELKMLYTSDKIVSGYRDINNPLKDSLAVEGMLGYRILRVKYSFKKSFNAGLKEMINFINFLSGKSVFNVFLNKKVKFKIKKIFSLNSDKVRKLQ